MPVAFGRVLARALPFAAALALGACQTGAPLSGTAVAVGAPAGSGPSSAAATGAVLPNATGEFAGRVRPYYVRVQPEATGLVAVNDDAENTYLEFSILPPGELKFFDAEGRPLRAAWVRNLAGLAGTHQGILLRLGTATSYVSLHPQADQMRKSPLEESAAIAELRDRLLQEVPRAAMSRALERAGRTADAAAATGRTSAPGAAGIAGSGSAGTHIVVAAGAPRAGGDVQQAENRLAREEMERTLERLAPPVAAFGTGASGGASAQPGLSGASSVGGASNLGGASHFAGAPPANASPAIEANDASWPRTQRVFFATNSVSISAPDDGLHRLIADARQADEVWIAGHTDSTGPRAVNLWLAKRRAEAIQYILTSRGVPPERIFIVRAPIDTYIASNETDIGRAQNRRVEVTFVRSRGATAAPRALLEPVAPGVAAARAP